MKSNTLNIKNFGELCYITFPKLESSGLVKHGFTTRLGGVSEGYLSSMNMSFNRGDKRANVFENYNRICNALEINCDNLVFTKQTHTNNVIRVYEKDRGIGFTRPSFSDIDGLVTNDEGVALVTQFADCTPLLFLDPVNKAIGSCHSGWKGTVKRIGEKTINLMVKEFGSKPKDIICAIGPNIGKCCYEVDEIVFNEFLKENFDNSLIFSEKGNGKYMLDLRKANEIILLNSGIKKENIDIADICTCCNSDKLFSHRASGVKRGNMAAIIELK